MDELRVGLRNRPVNPGDVRGKWEQVAYARMPLDGDLDGWTIDAEFELVDGVVLHRSVNFEPAGPVPFGQLSHTALKRLSLKDLLPEVESLLRQLEVASGLDLSGWTDALSIGKRPGKRGQDPALYLLWAQRRVEAEGKDLPPIKWLAHPDRPWGGLYFTEAAINAYVLRAREKGFLTPKGEPVALTERAERLIEQYRERIKEMADGEH